VAHSYLTISRFISLKKGSINDLIFSLRANGTLASPKIIHEDDDYFFWRFVTPNEKPLYFGQLQILMALQKSLVKANLINFGFTRYQAPTS
jgi:hypothetical protein